VRRVNEVRLAKLFFLAERLGGVFYDRFAAGVENRDVSESFAHFAGEEHDHADWYTGWLRSRGHEPPSPTVYKTLVVPPIELSLYGQPLKRKLVAFSRTEAAAARHLRALATKIRDPELKAIVERTIPYEDKHALWYERDGRRMLRARDSR
jgi:rubrerythrin